MSDIGNRQAYVFLDCSPESIEWSHDGDETLDVVTGLWVAITAGCLVRHHTCVRRPIPRHSQSDGQTIEQRVTALEARLNAQPTAQPSEQTCKWTMCQKMFMCINPHIGTEMNIYRVNKCPTCGLRIEVTE